MKKHIILFSSCVLLAVGSLAQSTDNAANRNNTFAFTMLNKLYSETKNTLVSPLSISVAMAITYEGAKGKTSKEIATVMGFDKNKKQHHVQFVDLVQQYRDTSLHALKMNNILMVQKDYAFNKDFIAASLDYSAMLYFANFRDDTQREAARRGLNDWVESQTNNTIKDLLQPGILDNLTRLVIVNSLYFNANWEIAFDAKKTRQMIFYSIDKQVIVPFMHGREDFNYYADSLIQVLELPYSGKRFSMVVFLPKNEISLKNFIGSFTVETYNFYISQMAKHRVDVLLPSFTISDESNLRQFFESLGMVTAFTGYANFKGMNGKKDLMIKDVVHKTYI